ncbi:UDP-N-acetylglucosamine transferase subunit ALG14 [Meyerozyma sp. JA9]|nr:UDP-N-acetylglucosamine transferase subunit ALG14 [Meyerozyma sp. JA9]
MESETKLVIQVAALLFPFYVAIIRLMVILPSLRTRKVKGETKKIADVVSGSSKRIMIFLGSGGHTGEMLRILEKINIASLDRIWIASSGDNSSLNKAKVYEEQHIGQENSTKVSFLTVPRARKVGESKLSAIGSTLRSFVATGVALYKAPKPDVVLLNGPGTSVPIAYILFAFKYFGLCNTRIIYIESLARVQSLSLSGRLVTPTANRIIVQWPQARNSCHRAEYYGILV